MKKSLLLLLLVLPFAAHANPFQSDVVQISIEMDEDPAAFRLACEPKLPVSELPARWVDLCNDMGRQLLELAIDSGMELTVPDRPFGMAGDFAQEASEQLPRHVTPTRILSPLFRSE